jgi:DNA-binding NarL/FixJ family response regulator
MTENAPDIAHVLIVEDQPDASAFFAAAAAEAFPGAVIETAEACKPALRWLSDRAAGPTVALIDLGLPDASGCALIRAIGEGHAEVLPIVVTIYDDDAHLFGAMSAGAQGYLLKDQDRSALVRNLHRIVAGEPVMSPAIARRVLQHFRDTGPAREQRAAEARPSLTPRETEVLGLIARGMRVGEAARLLGLTEHTVAGYVKGIYQKLNVSSRAEAALEAAKLGLV